MRGSLHVGLKAGRRWAPCTELEERKGGAKRTARDAQDDGLSCAGSAS
jgi:hypothetical protein